MSKVIRRRNYRKMWLIGIMVFVAVSLFTFLAQNAQKEKDDVFAANLADFDAGYIISDYQMGNYNSMTEAQIQSFLDSKISCNKGKSYYDYLVRTYPGFSWNFNGDHIVCLNEERFGDGEVIGTGDSAAHIIWQAAQDYRINPQVLIVLLQKEQGLITDAYPNTRQYRAATGYGCPDTAPCASEYYGFKNQVRKAAAMFRTVLDGGWTNYPLGDNWVRYSDKCSSGSTVNIKNLATSALYRYTPYQPNAAALAAGYSSVPGNPYETCAAYGNRNFYLYFEDWFGGITMENPRNMNFEDGIYNLQSKLVSDYGIAYVESGVVNSDTMSSFVIKKTSAGNYTISDTEDLYLTAVRESDGSYSVVMKTKVTDQSQEWIIYKNNDDAVSIYSALYPTMVLDVQNGSANVNTRIQLYDRIGTINFAQEWIIKEAEPEDLSGNYYIMSAISTSKAIDISNASVLDGANVQIYANSEGNKAQEWSIKKEKEGYYTIASVLSGKVLDVSNGILQNGSNVQIYAANGSCAQRWRFRENLDGTYTIKNYCDESLVLDVQDAKTNLQIYSRVGSNNKAQKWTLKKIAIKETTTSSSKETVQTVADGVYSIHPLFNTKKALDVEGGSYADGANVQIYSFSNGNKAQEWEIKKSAESDYYIIKNANSQKALDVAGGILHNNTNIWMYTYNDSCAQRWLFQKQADGTFVIKNACQNSMVLDVQDFYINVQLYIGWGGNNTAQKWQLNKIR